MVLPCWSPAPEAHLSVLHVSPAARGGLAAPFPVCSDDPHTETLVHSLALPFPLFVASAPHFLSGADLLHLEVGQSVKYQKERANMDQKPQCQSN